MYKNEYDKSMETYKKLMSEYEEIVNSEKYRSVCETMPFDFLNAKQKADTLNLFHEVGGNSPFHFKRADDAISFMYGFVDVKNGLEELLNGASYVASAEKKAEEINDLVECSPYLPSNLKLSSDNYIYGIARDCLKTLPSYHALLNSQFKKAYVESCIESLSVSGLQKLISAKIIGKKDIEIVRASGSNGYREKMNAVREAFGMENLYYEKHDINLAGTTFKNEDGTERQKLLAEMKNASDVELTVEKGTWQKAPGVEKACAGVLWEGKTIGFVPQGTVDAMIEKYKNPEYEATLKEVVGGGDVNYGCNVELGIVAKELNQNKEEEKQGPEK